MRLKYRLSLAIIAICMVITMFVASSYALWSITITQESKNAVEAGCFTISFTDVTSSINLDNAYPVTDAKGMKTSPYTFQIKNVCTVDARVSILLNVLEDSTVSENLIKYSLILKDAAVETPKWLKNAEDMTLRTNTSQFGLEKAVRKVYEIGTVTLKGSSTPDVDDGASATYNLKLWIDESATNAIFRQKFEAALSTVAYATTLP